MTEATSTTEPVTTARPEPDPDFAPAIAEMLTATATSDPRFDPVFELIEEHRTAYAEWDRLSQIYRNMLGDSPEFRRAYAAAEKPAEREVAALDALIAARPITTDGLCAMIEYLPIATRQTTLDNGQSEEQRALDAIREGLLKLGARADLIAPMPVASGVPTNIHRLTATWRAAAKHADDETLSDDVEGNVEMDRRTAKMVAAGEAVIYAPIATARDLACKVEVLQSAMDKHDLGGGWPNRALRMVCNGIGLLSEAEAGKRSAQMDAASLDLSAFGIKDLARLFETLSTISPSLSNAINTPCFYHEYNLTPAGKLLEHEDDRLSMIITAISEEIAARRPKNDSERDDRLSTLVSQELRCEGRIVNDALLSEIAAAWEA